MAGCPCGLEVEASGDAVDVETLASEVEAGEESACHGAEIDFLEPHAAAGDEFVFVGGLAGDLETAVGELVD